MKLADTMQPTTAEQRPPVAIPELIDGAPKELRSEFAGFQTKLVNSEGKSLHKNRRQIAEFVVD